PAIGELLEPHQMRGKGRRDVGLALDGMDRIILAAEQEGRALDATQLRKHVEPTTFAAGSTEPAQHIRSGDHAPRRIRVAWNARVMRHRESPPGVERRL